MAYIEREKLIEFLRNTRLHLPKESKDFFTRDEMLLNFEQYVNLIEPAADVVSRSVLEQIKWERDEAFSTLERHGLSLGSNDDVVEVVRCKDCKYAFHHPLGYIYCHRDGRNSYEMVFEKDSFCSYGVRKDGE